MTSDKDLYRILSLDDDMMGDEEMGMGDDDAEGEEEEGEEGEAGDDFGGEEVV